MKIITSLYTNNSNTPIVKKQKKQNITTNTNRKDELPNYNSSICFYPTFARTHIPSTTSALDKQSESKLYSFCETDKTKSIPDSFANSFADKKTNIIGAGSIFSNFFHIDEVLDSYFGTRKNISIFDPKFLKENVDNNGYPILKSMEDVKSGSAFIFSPNRFHTEQIKELSQRQSLDGVYVDKPMCISRKELGQLNKAVKDSKTPLYFGDYFYFGQIAGLRLMGVPMPYKDSVTIDVDNTEDKKFTKSIENAIPFFKEDEISSIYCNFSEQGADSLLDRQWLRDRKAGGGVLLDLQVHASNLLNLMGLELTDISSVYAGKYPWKDSKMPDPNRENSELAMKTRQRGVFVPLEEGDTEDRVIVTGKINDKISAHLEVGQYMKERSNTIIIEGKNSQKVKITIDDFDKRVEVLDKNDKVLARAYSIPCSYSLMLHHAQTFFNDKKTNKTPMFFDTQKKTLEQIFTIKDIIDRQIRTNPPMKNIHAYNSTLLNEDDEMDDAS
ncbi:hypothetical protein IJD15_05885 [bacterium]|nr:hypothetical protein [bacterium]